MEQVDFVLLIHIVHTHTTGVFEIFFLMFARLWINVEHNQVLWNGRGKKSIMYMVYNTFPIPYTTQRKWWWLDGSIVFIVCLKLHNHTHTQEIQENPGKITNNVKYSKKVQNLNNPDESRIWIGIERNFYIRIDHYFFNKDFFQKKNFEQYEWMNENNAKCIAVSLIFWSIFIWLKKVNFLKNSINQ